MTEFFFNGQKVSEEEMQSLMEEAQGMIEASEREFAERFGVSLDTAAAAIYLRSRSRWSVEKELELIERDRAGDPIPLSDVLSGEF